ncbi:PLP-dependent aspartate aminotransferase family protein [bacterium]|nr:PLP-dependent aspartate aminotransferase family protein [bacterium]
MKFSTLCIHAGVHPDPTTGAIMTPIFQTSTYAQPELGKHLGYEYSRTDNPTRVALQESIAALEGGQYGLCFSSGMGAIDCLIATLSSGDHVIAGDDVYGGTFRIFKYVREKQGITSDFIDLTNLDLLEQSITPKTKWIWLETPTNPLLKLVDIQAVVKIARAKGVKVAVDNTFATPYFQKPLALGADLVMHSVTKYLNGHSDVVMGSIVLNDQELYQQLKYIQNACGAVPGPMDCFLTLRGIKTLAVRMERHQANAAMLAKDLETSPHISWVRYPGLKSHPQQDLAMRQMTGFAGMISFELKGGLEAARKFVSGLKLFTLAESLGGVESLCDHPAIMTHATIPRDLREKLGVTDGLIRLSVGLEDVDDLRQDLANGFQKLR